MNFEIIDENGFLKDENSWNREIAVKLARFQGIGELSEDHWKVLNYIRGYFLEHDRAPMIRKVCQVTGFKLQQLYRLFPLGPAEGACKIAGLKKLDGCA